MTERQHQELTKAAQFFTAGIQKAFATANGISAESVVAAAAWMAGAMIFRTFGLDAAKLVPGTYVVTPQANVVGPKLVEIVIATLEQLGHKDARSLLNVNDLGTRASQTSISDAQNLLNPLYAAYCKAASLSYEGAAYASAISVGILIHNCSAVLKIDHALSIAISALVEGSKTAPVPFKSSLSQ